jgi:hypothetical protein
MKASFDNILPENQGRRHPKFKSKSKNQASSVIALRKDVAEIAEHGKAAIPAAANKITKRGRHDSRRYHQRCHAYIGRRANNPLEIAFAAGLGLRRGCPDGHEKSKSQTSDD